MLTNLILPLLGLLALSARSDANSDHLSNQLIPFTRETEAAPKNIEAIVRRSKLVCQVIRVTISNGVTEGITASNVPGFQSFDPLTQASETIISTFVPVTTTDFGSPSVQHMTGGAENAAASLPVQPNSPVGSPTGIPVSLPVQPRPSESGGTVISINGPAPPNTNNSPAYNSQAGDGNLQNAGNSPGADSAPISNIPVTIQAQPAQPESPIHQNPETTIELPPTTVLNPINGPVGLATTSSPPDIPVTLPVQPAPSYQGPETTNTNSPPVTNMNPINGPAALSTVSSPDIPLTLPVEPFNPIHQIPETTTTDPPPTTTIPNPINGATGLPTISAPLDVPIAIPLIISHSSITTVSNPSTTLSSSDIPIRLPVEPTTIPNPPPTTSTISTRINGHVGVSTVSTPSSPDIPITLPVEPTTTNPPPTTSTISTRINGPVGVSTVSTPSDVPVTLPAHCPPNGCSDSLTVTEITSAILPSTAGGSATVPLTQPSESSPMIKLLAREIEIVESTICFWEPDEPPATEFDVTSPLATPEPTANNPTSEIFNSLSNTGSPVSEGPVSDQLTTTIQTNPSISSGDTSGSGIETGSAQSTFSGSLAAITASSTSTGGAPTLILDWPTTTTTIRSTGSRQKPRPVWLGFVICFIMIRGWL